MKYYAGIGSRETPPEILVRMREIATKLSETGWILRSGGAKGADSAFAEGATLSEIFKARDATPEAIEYASKFHPAWDKCNEYARALHGRNAMIILGADLKTPVRVVYYWTKTGTDIGGTGLGMRIAVHNKIPIIGVQ